MTLNLTKIHSDLVVSGETILIHIDDQTFISETQKQILKANEIYERIVSISSTNFQNPAQPPAPIDYNDVAELVEINTKIAAIVEFMQTCAKHDIFPFGGRDKGIPTLFL